MSTLDELRAVLLFVFELSVSMLCLHLSLIKSDILGIHNTLNHSNEVMIKFLPSPVLEGLFLCLLIKWLFCSHRTLVLHFNVRTFPDC